MRSKKAITITNGFICTNHIRGKCSIFSADLSEYSFDYLSSCLKWLETIPSLLLRVMLNSSPIGIAALTKNFFKTLWRKAEQWCELQAHLSPTLIRTLCSDQ